MAYIVLFKFKENSSSNLKNYRSGFQRKSYEYKPLVGGAEVGLATFVLFFEVFVSLELASVDISLAQARGAAL